MIKTINFANRACENCLQSEADIIWQSESLVKRSKNMWRFPYNISICKNCGFCFSSPGPSKEDLNSYHKEGLSGFKEIGLPYSIEKRIKILKKYANPKGIFVEVGGDAPFEFHSELEKIFKEQIAVDISEDIPSKHRNLNNFKSNSVDIVTHYDVLEHVLEVKDFLSSCHKILKCAGIMICEVPNMRLYPKNLVMLEFEHVNHFSVNTLSSIASQVGFELIDVNYNCSRPHGFLSVFKKVSKKISFYYDHKTEYIKSLACIKGGIDQIKKLDLELENTNKKMELFLKSRKKIVIWAVTDLSRRLIEKTKLNQNVKVVDSDPRRKDHLLNFGIKVYQPKEELEYINQSDLLIISAARYKNEILDWILQRINKTFEGNNLIVLGDSKSLGTMT